MNEMNPYRSPHVVFDETTRKLSPWSLWPIVPLAGVAGLLVGPFEMMLRFIFG
jgi:hypothetical protein